MRAPAPLVRPCSHSALRARVEHIVTDSGVPYPCHAHMIDSDNIDQRPDILCIVQRRIELTWRASWSRGRAGVPFLRRSRHSRCRAT
jgi:hypothetical protein